MSTAIIDFAPRPSQMLILKRLDMYRFVVAVCHRRLGKTLLAVNWLIREGFEKNIKGYRGYYFCSTQKQAKIVSWQYFKNAMSPLEQIGLVKFNETELRIDLPNDGKIYLGSAESIENYRGIYIDRIVLDEVASWPNAKYAYSEVLRPAMADRQAHALIIGTVKGLDQFYEFYQYGVSENPDLKDWRTIDLKVSATQIIPESELRMLRATMSPDAYDREFENNFFASVPDILITANEVIEARNRELDRGLINSSEVTVGIDIGLTGDPSAVAIRQGLKLRDLITIPAEDPMLTASKLSRLIATIRPYPTRIFGDAGQGMAVLSRLRDLGHNAIDIFFNATSDEVCCFNKRSAMAYRVKNFLREGQIPHDDELMQEMVNQHLQEDPNNKIRLVNKRKIREIIGRSPNKMDAFMLTFAESDPTAEDVHGLAKHYGVSPIEMKRLMKTIPGMQDTQNLDATSYDVLNHFNNQDNELW